MHAIPPSHVDSRLSHSSSGMLWSLLCPLALSPSVFLDFLPAHDTQSGTGHTHATLRPEGMTALLSPVCVTDSRTVRSRFPPDAPVGPST